MGIIVPVLATAAVLGTIAALVNKGEGEKESLKLPPKEPEGIKFPGGAGGLQVPKGSGPVKPPSAPKVIPKAQTPKPQIEPKIEPSPAPPGPFPLPPPKPPSGVGVTGRVTATNGLNVRSKPDTSGAVVTLLPFNSIVTLPEPGNTSPPTAGAPQGWAKVLTASGLTGFASLEFLETSKGTVAPALPKPAIPLGQAQGTVVAQGGVNVRSAPNTGGSLVGLAKMGEKLNILEPTKLYPATAGAPQGWWHVQMQNGKQGYASAQYVIFGSAKELAMTPEEARAYHDRLADKEERAIYAGEFGANDGQFGHDFSAEFSGTSRRKRRKHAMKR